jgi:hypothetical protein
MKRAEMAKVLTRELKGKNRLPPIMKPGKPGVA